jgi:hypothetical protein
MISDFEILVTLAIKANKENRKMAPWGKEYNSASQWLEDFCTIHIDTGRGVGKTQYIVNNLTDKDIVFVFSKNMKKMMEERLGCKKKNIFIVDDFINHRVSITDIPENIYIDEPFLCLRDVNLNEILRYFANPSIKQTIIMLGK